MAEHELHRHLEISDTHGTVASADVTITQTARTARASLRAAAGHLAPGVRARLVDAVLDLPELHGGAHLEAAFPLGDSETLYRLRERCTDVTTHPAGATALLEANIGPGQTSHAGRLPPQVPHPRGRDRAVRCHLGEQDGDRAGNRGDVRCGSGAAAQLYRPGTVHGSMAVMPTEPPNPSPGPPGTACRPRAGAAWVVPPNSSPAG
jgi:hypothetical protein